MAQSTTDLIARAINVKLPFGTSLTPAKGDGTTDDTPAIQAIIDYVASIGGGTVFIPKGTYRIVPYGHSSYYQPTWKIGLLVPDTVSILVVGYGSCLKLTDNFGGTYCSLISSTGNLTDVFISDLRIDLNGANNAYAVGADQSGAMYAIKYSGLEHCRFSNIYVNHSGMNAFYISGNDYVIERCSFTFSNPTSTDFDNSTIYATGTNYRVINNNISTASINPTKKRLRGAIELHGGSAVSYGNTITNAYNGFNVTPLSTISSNDLIEVYGNTIRNCANGIILWPITSLGTILDGVKVHNNDIYVTHGQFQVQRTIGIGINYNTGDTYALCKNVDIDHNKIVFEDDTLYSSPPLMAQTGGIVFASNADIENINIRDNDIVNAPLIGIVTGVDGGSNYCKEVLIKGNHLINPGISTRYISSPDILQRVGIGLYSKLVNCYILKNIIEDTLTPMGGSCAFRNAATSCSNVIFENNKWTTVQGGYYLPRELKFGDKVITNGALTGVVDNDDTWVRYSADTPTTGSFYQKDIIHNIKSPMTDGSASGWRVLSYGTLKTLSDTITGTIDPSNNKSLILSDTGSGISNTAFSAGDWILLNGSSASIILRVKGNKLYLGYALTGGPFTITFVTSSFAVFSQVGYRTNSGTPSGVLTPLFIGESVLDTTNAKWYKATGTGNTNWA